jgi:GNAT superfamily N-acetyltransferase
MNFNLINLARRLYYNTRSFIFEQVILNIYAQEATASVKISPFLRQLEVSQATGEQCLQQVRQAGDFLSQDKLRDRINNRDICFFALLNKKPIHFSWISFNRAHISEIKRTFTLSAGQAYIYHCFTHPDFRGRGTFPFTLSNISDYLRRTGVEDIFISSAENNRSSNEGIVKAGFSVISRINYLRLLGFKFYSENRINERYGQFSLK